MAELKPCPFCGSAVKFEEEWADAVSVFYSFNCDSCGMYCFQNELVPQDIAIEAWTNRVENEELEFTRSFIHEHGLDFALASAWKGRKKDGK